MRPDRGSARARVCVFSALENCLRRASLGREVAGVVATEAWGGEVSVRVQAMFCMIKEAELSRGWGQTVTAEPRQRLRAKMQDGQLRPQQVSGPWAKTLLDPEQGSLRMCSCEATGCGWFLPIYFSCPNR